MRVVILKEYVKKNFLVILLLDYVIEVEKIIIFKVIVSLELRGNKGKNFFFLNIL